MTDTFGLIPEEDYDIIEDRLESAGMILGDFIDWYEAHTAPDQKIPDLDDFGRYIDARMSAIVNYRTAS